MARAKSFLQLRGSMSETTFRKVGNKNYAQDKLDISRESHKGFALNMSDANGFSTAARAGKLLRNSIKSLVNLSKDNKMTSRLLKVLMKMSEHGIGQLPGFNFNEKVQLNDCFNVPYNTLIQRHTGQLTINIKSFIPAINIKAPKFATHMRIVSAGLYIDFN